jgi:hypothetical protein
MVPKKKYVRCGPRCCSFADESAAAQKGRKLGQPKVDCLERIAHRPFRSGSSHGCTLH